MGIVSSARSKAVISAEARYQAACAAADAARLAADSGKDPTKDAETGVALAVEERSRGDKADEILSPAPDAALTAHIERSIALSELLEAELKASHG